MSDETNAFEVRLQEIEGRLRMLGERTSLPVEALEQLRESNKALVEQFRGRWTVYQPLLGTLGLLATVTFAYQLFKADEARRSVDTVLKVQAAIEEDARVSESALGALALSFTYLHQAARDHVRQDFYDAQDAAQRGDQVLKQAIDALDKVMDERRDPDAASKATTLPREHPLKRALVMARVSALSLAAAASFRLKDYDETQAAGIEIQALDKDRWEGYHFKGIGIGGPTNPDDVSMKAELAQYELSMTKKPRLNVDSFNMTELYLAIGNFGEAARRGQQYLDQRPGTVGNRARVGIEGYVTVAKYLKDGQASDGELKKYSARIKKEAASLKGTFDPDWLAEIIRRLEQANLAVFKMVDSSRREKAIEVLRDMKGVLEES